MRPRLIVFAKAPVIGGAKSRLALDVGSVRAWRIYRAITSRTLRAASDPRWSLELWASPDASAAPDRRFDVWPKGIARVAQGAGELGARIERALGRRGPSVVIGTDAPGLRRADVSSAFRALRQARVVYGPAADGGFWLLGVRDGLATGALEGVRWSSPHTLADVEARLGEGARLRVLIDVDDAASLKASAM